MSCQTIQTLLSEYVDDALSARDTFEVERHLADCHACTAALNELRHVVAALAAAPPHDVPQDFMEKLQARLSGLEPSASRRTRFAAFVDGLRLRAAPALGAAVAACVLLALVLLTRGPAPHSTVRPAAAPAPEAAFEQAARAQNVVLTAASPLDDLAAENLAAHSGTDAGADAEGAF